MSESRKPIRFIGGKYVGLKGWLDLTLGDDGYTAKMAYVVVDVSKCKGYKGLKELHTRVLQDYVGPRDLPVPTSYEEAALQQHPKVEQSIDKLAKQLAQLGLEDHYNIVEIFSNKMKKAIVDQMDKGDDALFYYVDYTTNVEYISDEDDL